MNVYRLQVSKIFYLEFVDFQRILDVNTFMLHARSLGLARTFHQGSGIYAVAGETVWPFTHIHVLHGTGTPVQWLIVRTSIAPATVGEGSAEM